MKTRDMIQTLLKGSASLGTFAAPELLRTAKAGRVYGIATSKDEEKELYLVILDGEPEGAIFIDDKGELFGDNAVRCMKGSETFNLDGISKELADALVMGCRVFEKSPLRITNYEIPEFGTKSSGLGQLTLVIRKSNEPGNGIRVSIRKDGKIVGSDVTTNDGSVGFRVMYGKYDCITQDRNQAITTFPISFTESNPKIILDL
jgi:hypothetical protein